MSAHPNDGRPRGIVAVGERALAAARMVAEGSSYAEVAATYGVTRSTVATWMAQVREATEDARNRAAIARGE